MLRCLLAVSFTLFVAWTPVSANVVYRYQGNNFNEFANSSMVTGDYDATMSVSGRFEVASPLAPNLVSADITASLLGFSFSEGRGNVTDGTATTVLFDDVSTDGSGGIVRWRVFVAGPRTGAPGTVSVRTRRLASGPTYSPIRDQGYTGEPLPGDPGFPNFEFAEVRNDPGVWTLVPEPATALLLALGLTGLGYARRR